MTFPVLPILSKVRTAESISGHIYIAIISYNHGRDLTGTSFQRDTITVLPILSKVRTAESISGHIYIAIISYSHGRDLTGTSFQRDTITVLPVHRNSIHYTGYINIIAFYYDGTSTGGTEGSTCNGNQLA